MSAKAAIHTFQGGMVKDLDKSVVSKERYLDARNFRLLSTTGESAGAMENIEGNNLIAAALTLVPSGMYVVGSVFIREKLILFLTSNISTPTTGRSMIVQFEVVLSTETVTNYSVLYDDENNNGAGRLKFSTLYPIKALGIYETPGAQKIYWCDGFNNIRHANIASYLTTDGLVKSGANFYFTPDMFEFLPEAVLAKPTLNYLYPGNITAGMVQYAYQYYTDHGAETRMSPLSNMIHIVTDGDYMANSSSYKGEGDPEVLTGKSVSMNFSIPSYDKFSHIRIVRLFYKTVNSIPTITIVGEVPIGNATSTLSFLDTGSSTYGTLTLDEFSIGETDLFKATDIAVKDSRLFAAGIVKEEFSIGDWDSRAVRFLENGGRADLYDTYDGVSPLTILPPATDDAAGWSDANWGSYTDTHDGINSFNDPANDGDANYMFKYQSGGTVLGAEGPNIKIGFTTDDLYYHKTGLESGLEDTSDNKSYCTFASPYLSGRRSWQRDETYRLYIVFFDAHGNSSSAKWICDLRMPSFHDTDYYQLGTSTTDNLVVTTLYPTVSLKSLPTGAVSAQLLRVERGGDDRSILTQALVIPMGYSTEHPTINSIKYAGYTIASGTYIMKLVSPEINITRNVSKGSSDYLEQVTYFGSTDRVTSTSTDRTIYTMYSNTRIPVSTDNKVVINDTLYVGVTDEPFSVNNTSCENYDTVKNAYGSSGLFVQCVSSNTWPVVTGEAFNIVNYRRDVHANQYGGQTFEAREGNNAIPASDLITLVNTTYTAWNGDTFINYFDVSTQLFDLSLATGASSNETVYVPLESSINLELRHDMSTSRLASATNSQLIQETAGSWINASNLTYEQSGSLYQYNTVYSQDTTAKFYTNIPTSVSTDLSFDCMVRSSKVKINGDSQDSFTLFPVNDFIEVSMNYGPLKAIETVNDKLLFWQTDAFGMLSVNERFLIQDTGGIGLTIGTGGILDRYDYISQTVGVNNNQHLVTAQSGVYWVNTRDRSMYRYSQNLQNLSKSKSVQSWFETNIASSELGYVTLRPIYDTQYNQVLLSVYNSNHATGETIVYDENIDAYTGFYDYYTTKYVPILGGFLSTKHVGETDLLFFHNSRLKERCCFYSPTPASSGAEPSTSYYVDSSVKILFNDDYAYTKVFDNLAFVSTATLQGNEIYNNTFSSIRCYNNYQNTDYCTLTYGTNLERDEREWTTFVPRNAVDHTYISNPDVFTALDKSRTFKERIRDKYMITDFKYTNTSNRRFIVPYVVSKYRASYR